MTPYRFTTLHIMVLFQLPTKIPIQDSAIERVSIGFWAAGLDLMASLPLLNKQMKVISSCRQATPHTRIIHRPISSREDNTSKVPVISRKWKEDYNCNTVRK